MTDVVFTREKHLGFITLNRVSALNALTLDMIFVLQRQLQDWQQDDSIHAVVIQAAPGKAFCAGGDVRWLYDAGRASSPNLLAFFLHEYRLNLFIHQFTKPYIALMDGITMGGGVGISLHGSHPIATENFVFAMPETSIGFFPDIGASYLLSRCQSHFGQYLGLTGNRLRAEDANALGLVKQVVSSKRLPELVDNLLATDLSLNPHENVSSCIEVFAESGAHAPMMDYAEHINQAFHFNKVEEIISYLETQNDSWHSELLATLTQKSPLSLKITLEQIRRAKSMDLADCLKMDYCLVSHFMRDHDFYEGVRALLIDKDKSPKWRPKSLAAIQEKRIMEYFECSESLHTL